MNDQEYLALAKQLKNNKEQIALLEDKENNYTILDEPQEEIPDMKGIIDKMKGRYALKEESNRRRLSEMQYSQQFKEMVRQESQESNNNRSRALSNALNPLR